MTGQFQKIYDLDSKRLDLQKSQVEQAIALREGYLDVIAEMTTGQDLVSQMLPDAARGVMTLQEIGAAARGEDLAGARRKGFSATEAFGGSMNVRGAPGYTGRGMNLGAGQAGKAETAYMRRTVGIQAESLPRSMAATTVSPDQAVFAEITGRQSGGLVKASYSTRDNVITKLAGGEFVVPNKAVNANTLPILEAMKQGNFMSGVGAAEAAGLGSSLGSMSISGGMKIGVLYLNGKVAGQDFGGDLGAELKAAVKNTHV